MQDDALPLDPDAEPLDSEIEPYDLDDETPLDASLLSALAPLAAKEGPPVVDLDEPSPLLTTRDRKTLSDEKERDRAIAEVLRDQARREVLRDVAYRADGSSLRLRAIAGALVVAALLVWFLPAPGFRASIPFPLAPEEETAGLKLATWVQAQQVEAFRQRRGRLPDVLRETGEALPGMTYERIDAQTYRLSGATERTTVTWSSTDTLETSVRETVARLRGVQP